MNTFKKIFNGVKKFFTQFYSLLDVNNIANYMLTKTLSL